MAYHRRFDRLTNFICQAGSAGDPTRRPARPWPRGSTTWRSLCATSATVPLTIAAAPSGTATEVRDCGRQQSRLRWRNATSAVCRSIGSRGRWRLVGPLEAEGDSYGSRSSRMSRMFLRADKHRRDPRRHARRCGRRRTRSLRHGVTSFPRSANSGLALAPEGQFEK